MWGEEEKNKQKLPATEERMGHLLGREPGMIRKDILQSLRGPAGHAKAALFPLKLLPEES